MGGLRNGLMNAWMKRDRTNGVGECSNRGMNE